MKELRSLFTIILLCTANLAQANGFSQEPMTSQIASPTQPADQWKFTIAPYAWTPFMKGEIDIKGSTVRLDIDPIDLIEDLDFVLQLHGEATKGPWTLFLDPTYIKISPSGSVGSVSVKTTTEVLIFEFGGYYNIATHNYNHSSRWSKFELLAGGRDFYVDEDVRLNSTTLLSNSSSWIVPMVGGRITNRLSDKTYLTLRGDVAGMNSDIMWGAWGLLDYQFTRSIAGILGYRYLDVDVARTTGTDLLRINIYSHGPVIGIKFQG